MHRSDITLSSTCEVCSSWKECIMSKKGLFEVFEKEVITLCGNERYLVSINRNKKHPADGSTTEITQENCRENIRGIFMEIIYNIVESLENKIIAYIKIFLKFGKPNRL